MRLFFFVFALNFSIPKFLMAEEQIATECLMEEKGIPESLDDSMAKIIQDQFAKNQSPIEVLSKSLEKFDIDDRSSRNMIIDLENNLRIDLMAIDIIDQVEILLKENGFSYFLEDLKITLGDSPLKNFSSWFEQLKEFSLNNKKLDKLLSKNIVFQLYDADGVAILHPVSLKTKNYKQIVLRNQQISKYNTIAFDPESRGLLEFMKIERSPFSTRKFSVAKAKKMSTKELEKEKIDFYESYCDQFNLLPQMESSEFIVDCNPRRKNKIRLTLKKGASKELRQNIRPLFNAVYNSKDKYSHLSLLSNINQNNSGELPGPLDFLQNISVYDDALKEKTYSEMLQGLNDEIVLDLRKWIKNNLDEIGLRLEKYNDENSSALEFNIKNPIRIRRLEALEQYNVLLKLFPETPWIKDQEFTLITPEGRKVISGKNYLEKIVFHSKEIGKKFSSPEFLISMGAGTGAAAIFGGNVMAGLLTKNIVADAVKGYRYDKGFKETFKNTPYKVITSVVNSSGFIPGKIPLAAFSGGVSGGLRSALTGQNIQHGVLVGATFSSMRLALPHEVAFPTVKMDVGEEITRSYASKSIVLDVGTNAAYHAAQGATVSAIGKKETLRSGALKGAAYGAGESLVLSSLFGVRYDMFGTINDKKFNTQIKQEANYHDKIGTYAINPQDGARALNQELHDAAASVPFRSTSGRWGWYVEKVMGGEASFSTPWFITNPKSHFGSADTMAHEVAHQIQYRELGGMKFFIEYGKEARSDGTTGSHIHSSDAEELSGRDFNKFEQYQSHGYKGISYSKVSSNYENVRPTPVYLVPSKDSNDE